MTVTRITRPILFALISVLALSGAASAGDDALARAKDLYLSAAYEDALTMLDGLKSDASAVDATEAAEYRVFCLLALQRSADAQKAIEGIVSTNPFYQPSETLTSPRIRAVFRDVRQAVLPSIVQRSYADAKAAFDRKDPHAPELFERLLALLDDPDIKAQPAFGDLRTVAVGFRDLSRAMAAPVAAVSTAKPSPPQLTEPVASAASTERASTEPTFSPPVTLSQEMPRWIPARQTDVMQQYKGTLEVAIDENGNVEAATITKSIHPVYDAELLKAARSWKFKPAMRNGVPTRYLKVIEVQLRPTT